MLPSFQRDKQLSANKTHTTSPRMLAFLGLLLCVFVHWNARMTEEIRRIFEVVLAAQITVILCVLTTVQFIIKYKYLKKELIALK